MRGTVAGTSKPATEGGRSHWRRSDFRAMLACIQEAGGAPMIRERDADDVKAILAVINDGARPYKGVSRPTAGTSPT